MAFSENVARNIAAGFLAYLRGAVVQCSLEVDRLPGWLRAARVRVGWINYSLVLVIEDAVQNESYEIRGPVSADTTILLDIEDFSAPAATLKARSDNEGLILLQGEYSAEGGTTFLLDGELRAFFNCGYAGYHGPLGLANVFFQISPVDTSEVVATRFIPLALYIHEHDAADLYRLWQMCEPLMVQWFSNIDTTSTGDFYASLQGRREIFALTKRSSVIVLGKDTGSELAELIQVRDYLNGRGYQAALIKDLPEVPMMSNEEKVRAWTSASRFCVMVDRVAAGHIAEYEMLKNQRSILALLRPQGSGSTYMIGDDHLVDLNYLNLFEFERTALGVLDDVIEWAERVALERAGAYTRAYPWR